MVLEAECLATMPADLLRVENLTKTYGNTTVLKGVSLALKPGERLALMGQSGSGKTTLLNLLGLMDTPTTGHIHMDGQPVEQLDDTGRTLIRQQKLGFVFQFFHLLPTMTIAENVALPIRLTGKPWTQAHQHQLDALLDQLGLADHARQLPGTLSGGQLQRAAIARALFHKPWLILADEPTGNLDSDTSEHVLDVLQHACDTTQTALIMVTHSDKACRIAHHVVHMHDGQLVEPAVRA
jgi:putative ABC transport system ATP-binding protein